MNRNLEVFCIFTFFIIQVDRKETDENVCVKQTLKINPSVEDDDVFQYVFVLK